MIVFSHSYLVLVVTACCMTGVVQRVLDVRDVEGIKALVRDHPDIDVLFNCAG